MGPCEEAAGEVPQAPSLREGQGSGHGAGREGLSPECKQDETTGSPEGREEFKALILG